jgi:hypothetical protein
VRDGNAGGYGGHTSYYESERVTVPPADKPKAKPIIDPDIIRARERGMRRAARQVTALPSPIIADWRSPCK